MPKIEKNKIQKLKKYSCDLFLNRIENKRTSIIIPIGSYNSEFRAWPSSSEFLQDFLDNNNITSTYTEAKVLRTSYYNTYDICFLLPVLIIENNTHEKFFITINNIHEIE